MDFLAKPYEFKLNAEKRNGTPLVIFFIFAKKKKKLKREER